jgi:hypothetical protein
MGENRKIQRLVGGRQHPKVASVWGLLASWALVVVLLGLGLGLVTVCDASEEQNVEADSCTNQSFQSKDDDPIQGLVDWVRAEGAFLSEKIEIRRQNPDDPTSPFGVFATQDIQEEETVLKMPRHVYLSVPKEAIQVYTFDAETEELDEELDLEVYFGNVCRLAKCLRKETELYRKHSPGESTKYAAFIRYLEETQPKGQLPAAYSKEAKAILMEIQGNWKDAGHAPGPEDRSYGNSPLPPLGLIDWIDRNFVQRGCINADDEEAYHSVELAIQRGYDTELIPIWDMVNHDNNKLNLDTNSLRSDEGLKVWASELIKAGDELYATYNFCRDCDKSGDEWGTPGIFRDFGFVEDYPQYWPFLDQGVYVRVEQNGSEFQASYFAEIDEESDDDSLDVSTPNAGDMEFFQEQLSRLKALEVDSQAEKLSAPHEKYMLRQYYQSLVNALTAIVDSDISDPFVIVEQSLRDSADSLSSWVNQKAKLQSQLTS